MNETANQSKMNDTFESLASRCRRLIAQNIDRYPADSIGTLPEIEWEAVVKMKYEMTKPKIKQQQQQQQQQKTGSKNVLSDGRSKPLFTEKFIKEIEDKNEHLRKSIVIDELVWRDCVNYKFKTPTSRPMIFKEPWPKSVKRLKLIGEELLVKVDVFNDHDNNEASPSSLQVRSSADASRQTGRIKKIIHELENTPMSVPLLKESEIGKVLRKVIKRMPESNTNLAEISTKFEYLLQSWKDIAKANGVAITNSNTTSNRGSTSTNFASKSSNPQILPSSISGKSRFTSDEQHAEDVKTVKNCRQWRDIYQALHEREQKIIKTQGAKMRKIREELEVDRSRIVRAKTSSRLNNKIRSVCSSNSSGSSNASVRKLDKLRQEYKVQKATIKGVRAGKGGNPAVSSVKQTSFGASVSNVFSAGKKRSATPSTSETIKRQKNDGGGFARSKREVHLNGGKKMKLPKTSGQLPRSFGRR